MARLVRLVGGCPYVLRLYYEEGYVVYGGVGITFTGFEGPTIW